MESLDLQVLGIARDWQRTGHAVMLATVIATRGLGAAAARPAPTPAARCRGVPA
jgi:hypothetical protein